MHAHRKAFFGSIRQMGFGRVIKTIALVMSVVFFPGYALAQGHILAPLFFPQEQYTRSGQPDPMFYATNLYPWTYSGDVWTGTVTTIQGRKISLTWSNKKGKIESFTGEVVPTYTVPTADGSSTQTMFVDPPSQALVSQKVMVYYITDTKKVKLDGKNKKVTTNYIFRLVPQPGEQQKLPK